MPTGPTVTVYPGPGKPFEVFQADDYACRQWAEEQIGGTSPSQTANQNLATGAVVGTLVGAGLGAAIGAATGNVGAGAAIGAGPASSPEPLSRAVRPLLPSISSRGATTWPISNACMRRETRSPVSGRCEPMGRRLRAPGYGPPPPGYGPPRPLRSSRRGRTKSSPRLRGHSIFRSRVKRGLSREHPVHPFTPTIGANTYILDALATLILPVLPLSNAVLIPSGRR